MRFAILLVLVSSMVTAAVAAPARPLHVAPEPPVPHAGFDLRDTFWTGADSADRNIYFHPDGTLGYHRGQKTFGSWKLEGDTVYFEFNNRYREFRGRIQGNIMRGDSWNVTGKRWHTELKLVSVPQSGPVP
jgi:hypothetical protein